MNEVQATQRVNQIVEEVEEYARLVEGQRIDAAIPISMGLIKQLPFIISFLKSQPYQFIDYKEDSFGITLYNRADIMDAFKRHVHAVLTGMCPDCGKPMSAHTLNDDPSMEHHHHEPPDRLN